MKKRELERLTEDEIFDMADKPWLYEGFQLDPYGAWDALTIFGFTSVFHSLIDRSSIGIINRREFMAIERSFKAFLKDNTDEVYDKQRLAGLVELWKKARKAVL